MQNMFFTLQKGLLLYAITDYFAVKKKKIYFQKVSETAS